MENPAVEYLEDGEDPGPAGHAGAGPGTCLNLVRYSERGFADLLPFFYAYALEQVGTQWGEWQATCDIWKKERKGRS